MLAYFRGACYYNMKYKIKNKKLLLVISILCLLVLLLNYTFGMTRYTIPKNLVQLSPTYCDNTLIGLAKNYIYFYDINGSSSVKLDNQYKKFCAKSKNDIIFLDIKNTAVHYYNGDYEYTDYTNVKDVIYTRNSYIFLNENGDVYAEDTLVCNIGKNSKQLAGTIDPSYSINDIWFINYDDLLCVYNIHSKEIIIADKTENYEFTPVNSVYISNQGKLVGITRHKNNYEFKHIDNFDKALKDITPINEGSSYLLLVDNTIKKIVFDNFGNCYFCNEFNDYNDSFQINLFYKDITRDWTLIKFVNNIKKMDEIFTSPYSNGQTHQIVFLKDKKNIYIYVQ